MPLPIMTDKEDIDAIISYLKKKPVGVSVDEAKATITPKLVDGRKLNAYRSWGFITDNGDKLTLTPLGREYSQASDDEKRDIYSDILNKNNIYNLTIEWIHNRKFDQIPASEVASHWYNHFRAEIGTETEQSLTNQVTCFMGIAAAAGLGEYRVGRKGQSTRFEINKIAVGNFLQKYDENDKSVDNDTSGKPSTSESANLPNQTNKSDDIVEPILPITRPPQTFSQSPALHIDIQIHIAADATLEQIDKIFESMAKHLYKNNNG